MGHPARPTTIAENQTASPVVLTDLGITVPASGTLTLSDFFYTHEVQDSTSLYDAIVADEILINDGSTTLTKAQSLQFVTGVTSADTRFNATGEWLWGNDSVSATTTTRYLTPGYGDGTAQTTPKQLRVPRAGIVRNLRVRQNTAAGNGNSIVYTLRVNGVASALTVSMASTANDGNDTTNSVTVTAGDLLDIEVTKAASVGTSPSDIVVTAEFAA